MHLSTRTTRSLGLAAVAMLTAWLCTGCEATHRASPLITDYDPADGQAEVDFWHGLAEQPVLTNNDMVHGLVELAQGHDPLDSYDERVAWLKDQGLLSKGFDAPADQAATRGTAAQVIAGILDIKGGITMRMLGPHPRYALRELIYLRIMRPSTPQQGMSGIQFVGIVGRAQDFDGRVP